MPKHQTLLLEWLGIEETGFGFLIKQFIRNNTEIGMAVNPTDPEPPKNHFAADSVTTMEMNSNKKGYNHWEGVSR